MIDSAKLKAACMDIGHRCAANLSSADHLIRFTDVEIGTVFRDGHPEFCVTFRFEDPIRGRFTCANFIDVGLFDCGAMPGDAFETSLRERCEILLFGDKATPNSAR